MKAALTVALAPSFPLMVIVSLCTPTVRPAFGCTVNVAVAPVVASEVVESVPMIKSVEVGGVSVIASVPVFVIVTVCSAGCIYGVCKDPNEVNGVALIV